jgi:ABC-type Zn2+ transport system substrate-binding protein/surface adhesin
MNIKNENEYENEHGHRYGHGHEHRHKHQHGHGHQNSVSPVKLTLKSASRANFIIVSPSNCPTAPAQYRRRTKWYSPHSVRQVYPKH